MVEFRVGDLVRFQAETLTSMVIEVDEVGLSLYVPDGEDYRVYDDVLPSQVTLVGRAHHAPPGVPMVTVNDDRRQLLLRAITWAEMALPQERDNPAHTEMILGLRRIVDEADIIRRYGPE